jgi:hypothetical protein
MSGASKRLRRTYITRNGLLPERGLSAGTPRGRRELPQRECAGGAERRPDPLFSLRGRRIPAEGDARG